MDLRNRIAIFGTATVFAAGSLVGFVGLAAASADPDEIGIPQPCLHGCIDPDPGPGGDFPICDLGYDDAGHLTCVPGDGGDNPGGDGDTPDDGGDTPDDGGDTPDDGGDTPDTPDTPEANPGTPLTPQDVPAAQPGQVVVAAPNFTG